MQAATTSLTRCNTSDNKSGFIPNHDHREKGHEGHINVYPHIQNQGISYISDK
jgi:hypothetical protein